MYRESVGLIAENIYMPKESKWINRELIVKKGKEN